MRWKLLLRAAAGILSVLAGAGVAVLTAAIGHCSAFGGACPGSASLEGDVIGGVAFGVGLAIAGPMAAWRPTRRGLAAALLVAVPAGLVAGLLVASASGY